MAEPGGGILGSDEELKQRKEQQARRTLRERADYTQAHVFAGTRVQRSLADMVNILHEWRADIRHSGKGEHRIQLLHRGGVRRHRSCGCPDYCSQEQSPAGAGCAIEASVRIGWLVGGDPAELLYRYLLLSPRPATLWNPEVSTPSTMHAFRYTGFDRSGEEALPDWIAELEERPTVYATLGTVHNHRTEILLAILEGLREEAINLIVTVGRKRDPLEFGEQPPYVHIERYIPQSLLLTHCDLVITHGGSGTMMVALCHGLPIVIIPGGADQPENVHNCAQPGVARVITAEEREGLPTGGLRTLSETRCSMCCGIHTTGKTPGGYERK